MKHLSVLVFVVAVVTCNYAVFAYDDSDVCPPPDQIAPCTCFRAPLTKRITALCTNFTNAMDIQDIFDRNPGWNLQDVHIDRSAMQYLPAQMLEKARFQSLNLSSSVLHTMFDVTPVKTPELNLYLHDVKLSRGFQWSDIANSTLRELTIFGLVIRHFGQKFIDNIPKTVKALWFENSNTASISPRAFANLSELEVLSVIRGSLKTISRDMFPKPTRMMFLDFSYHRISKLPEDIFSDMPHLGVFRFEGNRIKTMSEKVFIKSNALYGLIGNPIVCNCDIKWITTGKVTLQLVKGECVEPNALKGRKLETLKPSDFSYCQ
ncbi:uncharacterized protein TNCT_472241 [Trichonephila clavata]|uniref:Uncharacterized protein n=1 Tax=Trichonephila clavata TaxID=2740835 RepID=A0A8X6LRE2_TRICU|nr:uncharacterized protein TNCT_472241 [Trichonephila clavata]